MGDCGCDEARREAARAGPGELGGRGQDGGVTAGRPVMGRSGGNGAEARARAE